MAMKNIGALWKKKSIDGLEFFSGVIEIKGEKANIILFPNSKKQSNKSPDYSIYSAQDGRGNGQQAIKIN